MAKSSTKTVKPIARITIYPLTAAVWRNLRDGVAYYSATFERSYRDDKGEWHHTGAFNAGDLLLLAKLADRVHSTIADLRSKERQEPPADE